MVTLPSHMMKLIWKFGYSDGVTDAEFAEPGLWVFANGAPGTAVDLNAFCADVAQLGWNAWASNIPKTDYAAAVNLRQVKASHYLTTGHVDAVGFVSSGSSSWAGSASGSPLPWQDTLCISPYAYPPGSFFPNAKSRRGRFYMPVPAVDVMDSSHTGIYDSTRMHAQVNAFKAMLNALLTTVDSVPLVPSILSEKLGTSAPIGWLAADQRIDTQRRREPSQVTPRFSVSL